MSVSLLEMVAAIAIAGVIFAGALIPVTQTVLAYQEAEADGQQRDSQYLATQRVRQLTASVWRTGDPPPGHAALTDAGARVLGVGTCELRQAKKQLQQNDTAAGDGILAAPVESFALSYQLADGQVTTGVDAGDFDQITAIHYKWKDDGVIYGGVAWPTDRALSGWMLTLPEPESAAVSYRRADHKQTINLTVKPWE